jgi:endonuclease YncB( thermonuclease family)
MAFKFTTPPWLAAALILASGGGVVALAAQAAQAATDAPAAVYWSDGDSGRLPDGTKFRLHDVDSPETGSMRQRGGAKCESERIQGYEAKEAAVELTRGKAVKVAHAYGPDRYGRQVVDLEIDGMDVALTLITEGTHKAWDYDGGDRKPDWCARQARVPVAF